VENLGKWENGKLGKKNRGAWSGFPNFGFLAFPIFRSQPVDLVAEGEEFAADGFRSAADAAEVLIVAGAEGVAAGEANVGAVAGAVGILGEIPVGAKGIGGGRRGRRWKMVRSGRLRRRRSRVHMLHGVGTIRC
jgi:hypothetical protein